MPVASSTAASSARLCPTAVSPLTRSANAMACCGVLPSKSFSMPRCRNHSRAFILRIVSPTTEKRKCPGSMSPAWMGPTGMS